MAFQPSRILSTKHIPFTTPIGLYSHYRSHMVARSYLPRRRFKASKPRVTALNKLRERYIAVHPMSVDPSLDRTSAVQVKMRRKDTQQPTLDGAVLTERQELRYRLERAAGWVGKFAEGVDERSKRLTWLAAYKMHRSRSRGVPKPEKIEREKEIRKVLNENSSRRAEEDELLAEATRMKHTSEKLIYLPNITLRMMRNHIPPGERYDPYVATFRTAKSVTKHDLKNLLTSVYGVRTTFIRTDNRIGRIVRQGGKPGARFVRSGGIKFSFKRAVVGLVEPFFYPPPLTESQLEKYFNVTTRRDNIFKMTQLQLKAMGLPRPPPGWDTRISSERTKRSDEIKRDLGWKQPQDHRVVSLALQNQNGVRK